MGRNIYRDYPTRKLPENDSQLKHIFRKYDGYIIDTTGNRKRILDIVNDSKNYLYKDIRGNECSARIMIIPKHGLEPDI